MVWRIKKTIIIFLVVPHFQLDASKTRRGWGDNNNKYDGEYVSKAGKPRGSSPLNLQLKAV